MYLFTELKDEKFFFLLSNQSLDVTRDTGGELRHSRMVISNLEILPYASLNPLLSHESLTENYSISKGTTGIGILADDTTYFHYIRKSNKQSSALNYTGTTTTWKLRLRRN